MGTRSGVLDHEADVLKLSLAELDAEIARCEWRRQIAPNAYLRKSFEKRLHWLGKIRARHFVGVETSLVTPPEQGHV